MKRNLLFNQTTALSKTLGKRLVMVLTMLLIVGIGQAWGADYELVSFSDIKTNDVIIIVGTKSGTAYAMTNDGGTSNPPKPSKVTISNNKITTTATNIIFTVTKNNDGTLTFANGTNKLYCTDTNNGVRVGTNTNNKFSFDTSVDRLKNEATTRWLGIYNTQDWRCYDTKSANNIKDTKTTFYRKVTAVQTVAVTGVSLYPTSLTLTEGDSETLAATVAPANATDKTVTWSTSDANIATVSNGQVTAIAKGSATITVKTTDGNKTATCEVTVNPKPKYTVTWDVNGDPSVKTQVTKGSKPTFPATPESCDDESDTFYGWSTAKWDGKINDVSTKTIYTSANDMPEVNGDVTYYAVFAKEGTSGSGTAGWSKVTSTDDLEAGAIYAISNSANGGTYLSTWDGGNNFDGSTSTICPLILGGSKGAWTFQISDGSTHNNKYLTATSAASNRLKAVNPVDNYSYFTISFDDNGNAVITCTGKDYNHILRYNPNGGSPIFACYSSGQSVVYLQKYSTGSTTTYSDYITTCTKETTVFVIPKCGGGWWRHVASGNRVVCDLLEEL